MAGTKAEEPVDLIVVTDGDATAWRAVRQASEALGLHPLEASRGNPTRADAEAIVKAAAAHRGTDPVVVMVDDQGDADKGPGERVLERLLQDRRVRVLGVVAVASNTDGVSGVVPDGSVGQGGVAVQGAVNKAGKPDGRRLIGDTVDVLKGAPTSVPIIGLGDPGKMGGHDRPQDGVPATRAALAEVLKRARRRPAPRD
jgi:stage V sporulation protein AE